MMKGKKGDVEWTILKIILALVGFFLVMTFIVNVMLNLNNPAGDEACRDSLVIMDYTAQKIEQFTDSNVPATTLKPWPKACKYEEVDITKKKTEDVEKEIVKLMERCWYKMGSGKLNPFKNTLAINDASCFVCFTFNPKKMQGTVDNDKFLSDLKSIYRKEGQNYYDYFQLVVNEAFQSKTVGSQITKNNAYAIVFWTLNQKKAGQWFDTARSGSYAGGDYNTIIESIQQKNPFVTTMYITDLNSAKNCFDPSWRVDQQEAETGQ